MNTETNIETIIFKNITIIFGLAIGCICGVGCYKELCDNDDNIL